MLSRSPVVNVGRSCLATCLLALASMFACDDEARSEGPGGGEPTLDAGGACPEGQVRCGGCIDAIAPEAAALQTRVFSRSCALSDACHLGPAAQEGLSLVSLDDLFEGDRGRRSRQAPALPLIEPGDPAASYLVRKLRGVDLGKQNGTGAPSTAMPPPPSPALCEAKIVAIERWIRAGAPR
jgi:hypothetical protein